MINKDTILLFFVFLFIVNSDNNIFAQKEWEENINLSNQSLKNDNYYDALKYANKALDDYNLTPNQNNTERGLIYYQIGLIYHLTNDILNAEKNYLLAEKFYKTLQETGSKEYADLVSSLAVLYDVSQNYDKAEIYYLKTIAEYELIGIDKITYCYFLYSLAKVYLNKKEFDLSQPLFLLVKNIYNKEQFYVDKVYTSTLINLGIIYNSSSDYQKSKLILDEAFKYSEDKEVISEFDLVSLLYQIGISEKGLGNLKIASEYFSVAINLDSTNLIDEPNTKLYYILEYCEINYLLKKYDEALVNINKIDSFFRNKNKPSFLMLNKELLKSKLYLSIGKPNKAFEALLNVENFSTEFFKNEYNSITYAFILNEIALLYYKLGQYENSLNDYIKSIEIFESKNTDVSEYANVIINYCQLEIDLGNIDVAEKMLFELIKVLDNSKEITRTYIVSLNTLSQVYEIKSDFGKAELLLREAGKLQEKLTGKNHIDYAYFLNNLGNFYFNLGNFSKSVSCLFKSSEIIKNIEGENSLSYAVSLNNIAILYSFIEDYQETEKLLLESIEIEKRLLGVNHPNYAVGLYNLAKNYKNQNNFTKAEAYLYEAFYIMENIYSENHPETMRILGAIGEIHLLQNKFKLANKEFIKCSNIFKSFFSNNNEETIWMNIKLAQTYNLLNDFYNSDKFFKESIISINENTSRFNSYFSENEKEQYFKLLSPSLNAYYSFIIENIEEHPSLSGDLLNNLLLNKNALLRSTLAMRQKILNSNNIELKRKYDRWIYLNRIITENQSIVKEQGGVNINEYKEESDNIERELIQNVFYQNTDIKWETIKSKLNSEEVCIEFFTLIKSVNGVDSKEYYAILIALEFQYPLIIKICDEMKLLNIFGNITGSDVYFINKVYGTKNNPNTLLYDIIWKPIEDKIHNKKKVYYSPTGILHKIAFNAIQTHDGDYLINKYELFPLFSLNNIITEKNVKIEKSDNLLLFGGIDYNTDFTSKEMWGYLKGTKEEVENISKITNMKRDLYIGSKASEEAFKENAPNNSIIHIASHGFFFPNPLEVKKELEKNSVVEENIDFRGSSIIGMGNFTNNRDPLMRSGIIFARANDLWSKDKISYKDDGILTASEVTQMDLRKTKLVVLSACETGRGDINGNEGVYGLQRAFKIAGVNNIVISLWQVPDKETKEFMMIFYQKLSKTGNIEESFYTAQIEVSKSKSPYFWAAFVLLK